MSHVAEADNPVRHRYAVLAPYLERVDLARSGKLDSTLGLAAWESSVVKLALGNSTEAEDSDADESWPALVVEGIAFLIKVGEDMAQLETSEAIPAETVTTLHARLMTDGAIGLALMEEIQRAMDAMVVSGRIDDAKKLTAFRNRIGQPLNRIKEVVGPVAYQAAERLAARMVPDQEEAPKRRRVAEKVERPTPTAFVKHRSHSPAPARAIQSFEQTPNRAKPLLMILGVLLIVWAVFILPLLNRPTLPVLTQAQMPDSEALTALVARPPSLFVEVDARAWNAMSDAERRQLVQDVGQVAQASGYTGALFRDAVGNSRARWLKDRGAILAKSIP